MKKLIYLLAAAVVWMTACDKSDPEVPAQSLMETVAGKYWSSGTFFTYIKDGEEKVHYSMNVLSVLYGEDAIDPGIYMSGDCVLGVFYCSPDGKIDKYKLIRRDEWPETDELLVLRNAYDLTCNEEGNIIKLTPNYVKIAERSIYSGVDIRLRSLTPEQIEFDMPINTYLDRIGSEIIGRQNTTGIRVVWNLVGDTTRERYMNFENPREKSETPVE